MPVRWRAWRDDGLHFKSFVVHHFMDAAVVGPAWAQMEQRRSSEDSAAQASVHYYNTEEELCQLATALCG